MKKHINNKNIVISIFIFMTLLFFLNRSIFGFGLLYFYILLITLTYMMISHNRFEVSMVISISLLLLLFIIVGILNVLFLTPLFLIIIACCCIAYLLKNRNKLSDSIRSINFKVFIVFTVLFIVAIIGGIGRYVHKWDEYSYWAYAAKVCINEKSIYSVFSRLGATRGYPPMSTIWHYIVSVFSGYSESNLYIGLSILTFIYMMPVFTGLKNKKWFATVLIVVATVFFPLLFNGSITYSLLYVDLLLGAMCSSVIIIRSDEKSNKKFDLKFLLLLVMITLLKVNGFVFAFSLMLLFYIKDVLSDKVSFINLLKKASSYVIYGIIILLVFVIWKVISSIDFIPSVSYEYKLIPVDLDTSLSVKSGGNFILSFCTKVMSAVDESIIYSFIDIPLFVYLAIVFYLIYRIESKKNGDVVKIILPYLLSYLVFYVITALSLFVMFSKYEASTLASFGRYLAPINISYMLYIIYKLCNKKDDRYLKFVCMIIICLLGFSNITYFVTDIKARRDTMHASEARNDMFKVVNENTAKDSKVFVINQTDDGSIMPLWYARYYCYPRIINVHPTAITWKIKTKSNSWDLKDWGLTKQKLLKHLKKEKFDYIFFYSATDELKEELKDVLDDNDLGKNKLYKIVNEKGRIHFEKVRS